MSNVQISLDSPISRREAVLWLILATVLGVAQLNSLLGSETELVGPDFSTFVPRLIDGILFYKAQGLAIPWYTPSYCGGLPYFPDPQSMYYSIPQALTFFFPPWLAIQLTASIMLCTGGISAWLICRRIFDFSFHTSLIAAVAIIGSGFFLARMNAGHLSYHSFPLILTLIYVLLDQKLPRLLSAGAGGLIFGYFAHSGFHMGPFIVPLALGMIGFLRIATERLVWSQIRDLIIRFCSALVLGALIAAPKLYAAARFLENFPREKSFDTTSSFLDAFTLLLSNLFFAAAFQPFEWSPWEYDYSTSPVFLVTGLLGMIAVVRAAWRHNTISRCAALLLFGTLLFAGLVASNVHGYADWLKHLPGFASFRVNMRMCASLLIFVIFVSGFAIDKIKSPGRQRIFLLLFFFTSFLPGERIRASEQQLPGAYHTFPIEQANLFYREIAQHSETTFQISKVSSPTDGSPATAASGMSEVPSNADFDALRKGASNRWCYFPLFVSYPNVLRIGEAALEVDGKLNFINPSCYVFSRENRCSPGEKIELIDRENLSLLLAYQNPHWKIPESFFYIMMAAISSAVLAATLCLWMVFRILRDIRIRL